MMEMLERRVFWLYVQTRLCLKTPSSARERAVFRLARTAKQAILSISSMQPDAAQAENWSREEVIERWHQLFNGTLFSQRHARGETLSKVELKVLDKDVALWRQRLMDISWFMRVLNESIARQANAEDNCTGRFWPLPATSALASCFALPPPSLESCLLRHLCIPAHRGAFQIPGPAE